MSDACEWITDRLPDYRAGRLEPEDRRALEAHIAQCDACARENRVLSALRRLPLPAAQAERWDRLADDVAGGAVLQRARAGRFGAGLLRVAAIVLAIAGASALYLWLDHPAVDGPWAGTEEPAPAEWDALMGTSGAPWNESAIPGWFTLDDLSAAELEQLLEEVGTT